MKVCTDACLFGAIVAKEIVNKSYKTILDIGTGTGLLSLILAQSNSNYLIDAVEINETAFQQAVQNFNESIFNKQLQAIHIDFLLINSCQRYDAIISNPPFFENDLKAINTNANLAKHSTALTLQQLLTKAASLLNPSGVIATLIPHNRSSYFEQCIRNTDLFCIKKIEIKQTLKHNYFRCIYILSKNISNTIYSSFSIKDEQDNYSAEFIQLLKNYYLYL